MSFSPIRTESLWWAFWRQSGSSIEWRYSSQKYGDRYLSKDDTGRQKIVTKLMILLRYSGLQMKISYSNSFSNRQEYQSSDDKSNRKHQDWCQSYNSICRRPVSQLHRWTNNDLLLYVNDLDKTEAALSVRLKLPSVITASDSDIRRKGAGDSMNPFVIYSTRTSMQWMRMTLQ